METVDLTPQTLMEYNNYFLEKGIYIDLLEDFFYNLCTLINVNEKFSFMARAKEIAQSIEFESSDDIKEFMQNYIDFNNSVISFMEAVETSDEEDIEEIVSQIFYFFLVDIYDDNVDNIGPIIETAAINILNTVLNKYNIKLKKNDPEFKNLKSEIEQKMGGNYFELIKILILMIDTFQDDSQVITEHRVSTLFHFLIIFTMNMNLLRKKEMMEQQNFRNKYGDTGRNDPCPCGSGLKFKKCCLRKFN